jgi:hypothetical protein
MKLTDEQILKIKELYPIKGLIKTSKELNISVYILNKYINKFSLIKKRNVELSQFENVEKKEIAWFLGFFWADGYICKDSIEISVSEKDADDIYKTLSKFGKWNFTTRIKILKNKKYKIRRFYINDKKIREFLVLNDYKEKSLKSPTKILEKINDNIKNYFFRGYIDGDGCFSYKNKTNNRKYFSITGNINMSWFEINKLFNKLNITYKINRKNRKSGNSSMIELSSRENILKIGNYIYDNEYDNIGLKRKFETFSYMKN